MLTILPSKIISFITSNTYRKEIIFALTLKLIALFFLWLIFIPPAEHVGKIELTKHFLMSTQK